MLKTLLFFIISVALSACGSMSNRFGPETLPTAVPSSTIGVVLLSAGAKEKCVAGATFLKVKRVDEKYFGDGLALLSVDAYVLKSDFTELQGNVHALALAPGKYYLAPWLANPYTVATRIPRFDFEIRPGEVTYLGNFYLSQQCGLSTVGGFTDEWARDEVIVNQRKPELNTASVRKQILRPSGFAVGGN